MAKVPDGVLHLALQFEGVLRASLFRYTRNTDDVDELLQETYARLLQADAGNPQMCATQAYCLTVARNVALDWLSRHRVVPIDLVADTELEVLDEVQEIEGIVNPDQELALLAGVVANLPSRCRQVFTLRKVYGYTQKEIAERLQITENTVAQHLIQAARRCAEVLFDSQNAAVTGLGQFANRLHRRKAPN